MCIRDSRYLYALESVSLPAGLTSIKDSAFYRCRRLQKVSGGESLKSIGEGAFVLCSDLTSFTFPEGLTTIESFAFQDTALSTVTLPASLKTCKELAFMRSVSTFNVAAGNPVYSLSLIHIFNDVATGVTHSDDLGT